jgi:hypothetical protein
MVPRCALNRLIAYFLRIILIPNECLRRLFAKMPVPVVTIPLPASLEAQ